jgi:hypothetical protein
MRLEQEGWVMVEGPVCVHEKEESEQGGPVSGLVLAELEGRGADSYCSSAAVAGEGDERRCSNLLPVLPLLLFLAEEGQGSR